jgi:hypothetical protein
MQSASNLSDTCGFEIGFWSDACGFEIRAASEPKQTIYVTFKMMKARQILTMTISLNLLQQVVTISSQST